VSQNVWFAKGLWTSGNQLRFQPTSSFIDLRMRSHKRDPPGPPMTLGNGRLFYQFNQLVGHVANSNGDGGDD
jgi:hypothetical protein